MDVITSASRNSRNSTDIHWYANIPKKPVILLLAHICAGQETMHSCKLDAR